MKTTKTTKTIFANYLILYLRKTLNVKEISQIVWWNDRFLWACKFSKKFVSESRCEKIIKTWNMRKYRVISYDEKTFSLTNFWACMQDSLVNNTNTQKDMRKRFRISVRNLIVKHESWYLWINDMINHLKISEIRKSWNRLIEMRKLFNVLNFWSK